MLKNIVFFGIALSFLVGCNTKFDINGEYVETPIVHFLLDQGQEYQFLKLNKTFLKEGDALEYAKDAELSYFDQVDAVVEEVIGGNTIRSWTLTDTVINNKQDGVFYGPEQKLYYFKANDLNEQAIYRLKIDIDNGAHIVSGQTQLVKGAHIKYPLQNQSFNLADNDVNANGYKKTNVTFEAGDGAVFNMKLRFDYVEYTSPTDSSHHSVLWSLGTLKRTDLGGPTATLQADGELFYQFLKAKIPADPNVIKRNVRGIDILLTAGSPELNTYILSSGPSSSLAQNKPVFTNVDGGLGIFSSRVTKSQYKPYYMPPNTRSLNQNSTKELCSGQYTTPLMFCSDIPSDYSKSYACP